MMRALIMRTWCALLGAWLLLGGPAYADSAQQAKGLALKARSLAQGQPPTFCALGDSITDYNFNSGSSQARGFLIEAQADLGMRFEFPPANNLGFPGQTSATILTHVPEAIATGASWCAVEMGTNDATVAVPLSKDATWANLKSAYDQLTAANIRVLAIPIMPRGLWAPLTGTAITNARAGYYWVNRQIRAYAKTHPMLVVADTDTAFLDPASGTGDPLPGSATDNLHPSNKGAAALGRVIADVLETRIPPLAATARTVLDRYDAAYNPGGDLLLTRQFSSPVATSVTGMTGNIGSGWTPGRSGSVATGTWSIETTGAPYPATKQVLVLGATGTGATGESITLQSGSVPVGGFVAGDQVRFLIDVEASGLVNVENVQVSETAIVGGSTFSTFGLLGTGAASDRVLPNWTKTIATPWYTVPANTTGIYCVIKISVDTSTGTLGGTLKFSHPSLVRKLPPIVGSLDLRDLPRTPANDNPAVSERMAA